MPEETSPARLPYASPARGPRGTRTAPASRVRRHAIAILALLLVTLWVGSYLYVGAHHSFGGTFASAPIAWKQLNYDGHYPWAAPLFYLHQPLAWLDQRITGTEVRTWRNNFHGDRSNYGREAFN
jgi:hypothetical protein